MAFTTTEEIRERMRNTPAGALLAEVGFDMYDTETSARRVAEHAAEKINNILDGFNAALDFAIDGVDEEGLPLDSFDRLEFLRMWREGQWSEIRENFPEFPLKEPK